MILFYLFLWVFKLTSEAIFNYSSGPATYLIKREISKPGKVKIAPPPPKKQLLQNRQNRKLESELAKKRKRRHGNDPYRRLAMGCITAQIITTNPSILGDGLRDTFNIHNCIFNPQIEYIASLLVHGGK